MKQATYAKIGAFALASLALAVAAFTLVGGGASGGKEDLFETYIEETVQGVSEGSAVKYRGIPVGSVKSVSFARARYEEELAPGASREDVRRALRYSRVVFGIRTDKMPRPEKFEAVMASQVAEGLRAHVKSQGITGLAYIDLDFEDSPRDIPVPWTPEYAYVPTAPSLVKTLTDVMQTLSQEIGAFSQVKESVTNLAARTSALADAADGALESVRLGLAGVPDALTSATNAVGEADSLLLSLRPVV
ncbi:MAG: MCE family protein, partial [Kiritimatiellae bacterium]|nr:MCE family protein [Kiritimatiellia bacterium]